LLKNVDSKCPPDYWSIFYDLHIDRTTVDVIRAHAIKLITVSNNMQDWNSEYGSILQIVNEETLSILQQYWDMYAKFDDPGHSQTLSFRMDCAEMQRRSPSGFTTQAIAMLARSFGPRLVNSLDISTHHVHDFWTSGCTGNSKCPPRRVCNPLALYSSTAGDRFCVHYRTNPLASFHLAAAISVLAPDSPFFPQEQKSLEENVVSMAKTQFQAWCLAFQQTQASGRLIIRFFIGEAVNFCRALDLHRTNSEINIYSSPWSSTSLHLDGRIPDMPFNVIDTSNLVDDVGFLNILTATVPLLEQSASSVLYTEMMRSYPSQANLLSEFLCGDVANVCALFGIVPASYVTGVSVRARDDAYTDNKTPTLNRVNWKVSVDGMSCNPKPLAALLYRVYVEMFATESIEYYDLMRDTPVPNGGFRHFRHPQPRYSRSSFAAMLAFIKPRISVDWRKLMDELLDNIELDKRLAVGKRSLTDLFVQLRLFGVWPLPIDLQNLSISEVRSPALKEPITCLIVTVPRRKLRVLYESLVEDGHRVHIQFQVHILDKVLHNTFSSIQPIFGKLTVAGDRTCNVERDPAGWYGTADLQLCTYVPAHLLGDPEISIRLQKDMAAGMLFRDTLPKLEIFKARLSSDSVHVVHSLPGLAPPNPLSVASPQAISKSVPLLDPENQTFTTRITISKPLGKVEVNCPSPYTLSVKCGANKYLCEFPFPIAAGEIVSDGNSIEVVVPLLPPQITGSSPTAFFPLVDDNGLCTWNLPYINFRQLPRMALLEHPHMWDSWLRSHLDGMYSDQEFRQLTSPKGNLLKFKKSIYSVFKFIATWDVWQACIFTIEPKSPSDLVGHPLIFIVTGVYFDSSSNSVVAEAYVVEANPEIARDPRFLPILMHTMQHDVEIKVGKGVYDCWRRELPAMAERCRDWEHKKSCNFEHHVPGPALCSCGVGKVKGKDVCKVWPHANDFVTRVAIAPLFASPYLEPSIGGPLCLNGRKTEPKPVFLPDNDQTVGVKCQDCGKDGAKKCGGCGEVFYCSRACQRRDWKKHKTACQKAQERQ
jgi:MYND finger